MSKQSGVQALSTQCQADALAKEDKYRRLHELRRDEAYIVALPRHNRGNRVVGLCPICQVESLVLDIPRRRYRCDKCHTGGECQLLVRLDIDAHRPEEYGFRAGNE